MIRLVPDAPLTPLERYASMADEEFARAEALTKRVTTLESSMKAALPNRYQVSRVGTPDPVTCDYYVLDAVHDYEARYCLRMYVNALRRKGNTTRADEIEVGLLASKDAHQKAMSAHNPKPKKSPEGAKA